MAGYEVGRFPGKVTDYGIGETQAGDPQVFVTFDVEFSLGVQSMTWFGSLKEGKAREITLKALLALGMKGGVEALLDGPDGAAIRVGIDASLVTSEHEYQGSTSVRIDWVNAPGGGGVKRAEPTAAKAKLLKLNLNGDLAKLRQTEPTRVDNGDVPF